MTEIFLVRHGETFAKTKDNELGMPFVCGSGSEISRNTHLTSKGKEQMFKAGKNLQKNTQGSPVYFEVVIVSDLIRSRESVEELLKGMGEENLIEKIIVDKRFTEINYGDDDGDGEEIVKLKKKVFFATRADGSVATGDDYAKYCNAESFTQAQKRMQVAIEDVKEKFKNKKILIVSHSGSMRAFQLEKIKVEQDLGFGEVIHLSHVDSK